MYIQKTKDNEQAKGFEDFLKQHPQFSILVFTFLNSGLAQYSIDVPPGMIHRVTQYAADTETEHEDVGYQVWVDGAIILPTLQQGLGGYEIPIGGIAAVPSIEVNYPVMQDAKLTVACNGLGSLTSGFTVIIEYMEMPIERKRKKSASAARKEKKT